MPSLFSRSTSTKNNGLVRGLTGAKRVSALRVLNLPNAAILTKTEKRAIVTHIKNRPGSRGGKTRKNKRTSRRR